MSMSTNACTYVSEPHQQLLGLKGDPATLSGDAIRLMLQVDRITPIHNLADRFPHIVNKLAEIWKRPYEAYRYFDELLHDSRRSPGRLPSAELKEISDLYTYYRTNLFPVQQHNWSKALYV
jgi:hypothetical protein